jgi:hypothetical protein
MIMHSPESDREYENSRIWRYDDFTTCNMGIYTVFLKLHCAYTSINLQLMKRNIFESKETCTHIFIFKSISHLHTLMIFLPVSSLICSKFVAVVVWMVEAHYKHQHENLTGWAQMMFTIFLNLLWSNHARYYNQKCQRFESKRACSCDALPPGSREVTPVQEAKSVLWFKKSDLWNECSDAIGVLIGSTFETIYLWIVQTVLWHRLPV